MAPDISLDPYVQPKPSAARPRYFYFRAVVDGVERRIRLPHPFDDGYRTAYNAAHREIFGTDPGEGEDPLGWSALIRAHKDSAAYRKLSKASRYLRDMACDLALERWGRWSPSMIRPLHAQALYDSLAARPPTANRRMDDLSKLMAWGVLRGFCDANPCSRVERVKGTGSYEPWPLDALETLFRHGHAHIVRAALVALYTGQRRGDVLRKFRPNAIRDGVWHIEQGKTETPVPVPLHPVVLAIVAEHVEAMRARAIIDPTRPILANSRGEPWGSGFGASWGKELIRLKLHTATPRLTFHGLRTTNATLIATAVAQSPDLYGSIERVRAQLGHLSPAMSAHYARQAQVESMNRETLLLLPDFGKTDDTIGKTGLEGTAK